MGVIFSSSCSWMVRHVSLFLDPQDEVGPSISSWVVLCFFVLLVYIVVLVLVVCLCPSSVHVVAAFPGTVLFPLLYLQFPLHSMWLLLVSQIFVRQTWSCCRIECRSASSFWGFYEYLSVPRIGYRPSQGESSGGAAPLMPLDLHAFL